MALEGTGSGGGRTKAAPRRGNGGNFGAVTPPKPVTPLPSPVQGVPQRLPSPVQGVPKRLPSPVQSYQVNGGGTGGGGGGIATDVPVGSAPVSEDDFLAGDSSFQLQLAALMKALQDGTSDLDSQRTRYSTDYNDAVKGLGWVQDDPATADVNESKWNFEDQNTAAGRAFQNQNNDFASRGLLQSSLYGTANDNLTRSLNDQLGSVNTAKTNFMDDLTKKQSSLTSDNQLSTQQARAEAIARRAAGIAI